MLDIVRNLVSSIFGKILLAIMVLSFALWGVGDILSSGNSQLAAKIGNEMTSILFADTYQHLHEEGELVVVTLSGMKKYIQRSLSTLFGNYEKVRQSGQYTLHRAIRHKDE